MDTKDLKGKPLWQMTGEEFLMLQTGNGYLRRDPIPNSEGKNKKYVYGISGIAQIFGCSMATANRIKKSGKIGKAITQIGRKIIVDARLALELAGQKKGGRYEQ